VLGKRAVDDAVRDWRSADLDGRVRATMEFLATLTHEPWTLTAADARAVFDAGVEPAALIDAVRVAALFNLIVRVVDALGVEALPQDQADRGAAFVLQRGYEERS
jgi:alkylhydroperoxidase family enzyme